MTRLNRRSRHDKHDHAAGRRSEAAETAVYLFDDWFDPIEAGLRDRVRDFIRTKLDAALARPSYARRLAASEGADGADAGLPATGTAAGGAS